MEGAGIDADDEQGTEEHGSSSRSWGRLKSKFHTFRRPASSSESQNARMQGISDFLNRTESGQARGPVSSLTPQIDISAAKAVSKVSEDYGKFEFYKPQRVAGLKVSFVASPPEIIGLGGEHAQEPAIQVSRARTQTSAVSKALDPATSRSSATFAPSEQQQAHIQVTQPEYFPTHGTAQFGQARSSRVSGKNVPDTSSQVSKPGGKMNDYPKNDLREMGANEGRAFLSQSIAPEDEIHREPDGGLDSETHLQSEVIDATQDDSPTSKRKGNRDASQRPQHAHSSLPSHLKGNSLTSQKISRSDSQPNQFPDTESVPHRPLQDPEAAQQHLVQSHSGLTGHFSPSPNLTRIVTRDRSQTMPMVRQTPIKPDTDKPELLAPAPGMRPRSSSNPFFDGADNDTCVFRSDLRDFGICPNSVVIDGDPKESETLPWNRIHVFSLPQYDGYRVKTRIIAFDGRSSFMDESGLSFRFHLSTTKMSSITFERNSGASPGVSLNPNSQDEQFRAYLYRVQSMMNNYTTYQTYNFFTHKDLHSFQAAVLGYTVHFDGVAASFMISRRRKVVSVRKTNETHNARIQILHKYGTSYLVCFLTHFEIAPSLKIELGSLDVFEASEGKDKLFCVKFVDAKMCLSNTKSTQLSSFIAMDEPEPATVHEDISLGFSEENVRDYLIEALPAPVTGLRKHTIRRRI